MMTKIRNGCFEILKLKENHGKFAVILFFVGMEALMLDMVDSWRNVQYLYYGLFLLFSKKNIKTIADKIKSRTFAVY